MRTSLTPVRLGTGAALLATATLVLSPMSASAAPPPASFAEPVYHPIGLDSLASLESQGAAVADLDGDGNLDIAQVAPWQGTTFAVSYGDGDGGFTHKSFTGGSVNANVIVGDYTGDGRLDIAVTGAFSWVVMANQGGRTFTQVSSYSLVQDPFQASGFTRDLNADGKADLALKSVVGIQIMLGNGDGTFATGQRVLLPGSLPTAITSIDDANLDGDAAVDLVAVDAGSQLAFSVLGNGDGTFRFRDAIFVPFAPSTVKAADLGHAGIDSLVVLPEVNPSFASVAVVRNKGGGDLGFADFYNGGFGNPNGTVADFNGDGHLDVVSSNTFTGDLVILLGVGDGTLATGLTLETSTNTQTPVTGDFDEDGRTDLAVPVDCPTDSDLVCIALLRNTTA